ncbi:helix-turn-helix domain-containing protein [Paenibacillus alkalitolerans]|uniref:helix-turn-helix domain-containing protein n=1 Tax=Paenibacillus alkalitolerans TaxID=2799335 RepID=UPI0018F74DB4|nr:helix-turn-helix domain-containing protein [Paenibacillus alkalitolerans]
MTAVEKTVTLCVIDDIRSVVEGISRRIPWAEYNIEVIGTAYNGEEGLRLIKELKPDIVVTDIRMPKMNGVEMASYIKEVCPGSKCIFISGYTEFDHARDAIRLGAFDYILKPFTSKQIVEVVLKARSALLEELSRNERMIAMEHRMRESMPLLKQEFLGALVRYTMPLDYARERWEFLSIHLDWEHFVVMVAEIDNLIAKQATMRMKEVETARFAVQNIMEETVNEETKNVTFRDGEQRLVCIMNGIDLQRAQMCAERCRENVAGYSRHTISLGLGNPVRSVTELPLAYGQAMHALTYNFYTGGNSVFSFRDIPPHNRQAAIPASSDNVQELMYSIRAGNSGKALDTLEEIFAAYRSGETLLFPQQLKAVYMELAIAINKVLKEKLDTEQTGIDLALHEAMQDRVSTAREIEDRIVNSVKEGCRRINECRTTDARQIIGSIADYIRRHLNTNCTVKDYADQVHLSPSYFANLFKKETGMSVMQFVAKERIERAKKLLLEDIQIQDIAFELGYVDRPYFSDVFKKHTGMTPTEFRQQYK